MMQLCSCINISLFVDGPTSSMHSLRARCTQKAQTGFRLFIVGRMADAPRLQPPATEAG